MRKSLTSIIPGGKSEGYPSVIDGGAGTHYTIAELSERFSVPATALKECFKSIYGQPINTYMRNFRMDQAALLLQQEPQMGVAEIAGRVGYDSSSKFAPHSRKSRARRLWSTGGKANKFFRPNGTRPAGRSGQRKKNFL